MKKICFITTVPITLEVFILNTAQYLYEKGNYDITFISDYDEEFRKKLPDYITYIPVKMDRGISLTGISAIYKMIKIFRKEKFNMVQYSTPNASAYASLAAKISNVPIRLYCQWGIAYVGFSGIKKKIFKLIEKMVCDLSTWIEPDSYGNLKFSQNEGLYNREKSSVIGSGSAAGVNLKKFDIQKKATWKEEVLQKYDIDSDKFIIGFVGRINEDKGVNELLSAFKQLLTKYENIVLMVVGNVDNTESVDEELYRWSINCQDIIYTGQAAEIEKYFATMDLFVLPSYREGFGSVVIEAGAMEVPVIVTNIPGPTEAMVNSKTGIIVKKKSISDLYNGFEYFINNRKTAEKMGINGREFVEKNFDSEIVHQLILEDRNRLVMDI